MPIRVLLVEDEIPARERLRTLLETFDWIEIAGEAGDGLTALSEIERLTPDAVLLDLQLPGLGGLEVARRVVDRTEIIFTTAFDQHALTAFELHAIDYLLKPFDRARLERALLRLRKADRAAGGSTSRERLEGMALAEGGMRRLFVRHAGRIVGVALNEVVYFEAQGDRVAIHCPPRSYLVHLTLNHLEGVLPPGAFRRVHRRYIVNLGHIAELVPRGNAQYELVTTSGDRLVTSRSRSRALRELAS